MRKINLIENFSTRLRIERGKSMSIEQKVTERIKDIIQERGLQYKFVCEKLGIEQVKFSQCMNGKRNLKTGEFLAICSLLNLNFDDFKGCQIG